MNINLLHEALNEHLKKASKPLVDKKRLAATLTYMELTGEVEVENGDIRTATKAH